jgi:hypothetical protein
MIGVVLGIADLLLFANTLSFVRSAASAPGKVVELKQQIGQGNTYAPRVRFTTVDGRQVEFVSSVYSSLPFFRVGEQVTVLYSPGRPESAEVQGFFWIWGGVIIAFSVSLGFAISGIKGIGLWVRRRRREALLAARQARLRT